MRASSCLLVHPAVVILDDYNLSCSQSVSAGRDARERVDGGSGRPGVRQGADACGGVQRQIAEGDGVVMAACHLTDAGPVADAVAGVEEQAGVRARGQTVVEVGREEVAVLRVIVELSVCPVS